METTNRRLLSLDLLRGLTVAGMILVNNGYGESFATLRHTRWNGLTACDLVFPFFLFIMGVSCYLSLSKGDFTASTSVLKKVLKRAALLFLLGLFINWFDHAIEGDLLCFGHLRVWAVLQRIALCYLAVSLFALYVSHRYTIHTMVALLVVYTILIIYGNGYAEDASVNILAQTDLKIFGYDHLYHKSPVDPEGLLGTISSVAHVLLGFYCGKIVKYWPSLGGKVSMLAITGAVLLAGGLLLSLWLPLNKRIWSPSYVLATCGLASLLLSAMMYWVDLWPQTSGRKAPGSMLQTFFRVFGVNALALYIASELLAIIFGHFGISDAIYAALHAVITPDKLASLAYALTFVAINFLLGFFLYKKRIFIKL